MITRQRRLPRDQWAVMIPGHHPGYISLETYDANIARLAANSPAPPAGPAAPRAKARPGCRACCAAAGAGGSCRSTTTPAAGPPTGADARTRCTAPRPASGSAAAAARDGAGRAARRARPRLPGRHRPGHVRHRSPVPPEPGRVRTRAGTGPFRSRAGAAPSTTTSSRRTGWSPGPWKQNSRSIDRQAGTCHALITWQGTATSAVTFPLPKRGSGAITSSEDIVSLVRLASQYNDTTIARILARQHRRTATGLAWTRNRVPSLRRSYGIPHCHGIDLYYNDPETDSDRCRPCSSTRKPETCCSRAGPSLTQRHWPK